MHLLLLFGLAPFLAGLVIEYVVCRFTMGKSPWWRWGPPVVVLGVAGFIIWNRYRLWTSSASLISALLLIPGLPTLLALFGLWAGWKLWCKIWKPRVIREK